MSTPAIVVVGSLHHDVMVEAPRQPRTGETLAAERWYPKFGGKGGNQALAVRRAGVETRFVGAVGRDAFGDFLVDALERHALPTTYVERLDGVGSGMSVAIVDAEGDYGAVIVSGANARIDPARLDEPSLWDGAALLLLQNEVPEGVNLAAARRARGAGLDVCLNAAPARELGAELESLIGLLVVNAIEAEALTGAKVGSPEDALAAAGVLSERFPRVVVTAGGEGAAVGERGEVPVRIEPVAVDVVGTHGAGDLFTGTLCAALVRGADLPAAALSANAAAARHVAMKDENRR